MRALLRSVWAEPRPPDPPARVWRDWVLVGLGVPAVLLEGVLRPELPFRELQVAVVTWLIPLLLWRRTRPLLVLVVFFVALDVVAVLSGEDQGMYSAALAVLLPYAVARWGSGREALAGVALVLLNTVGSMVLGSTALEDVVGGSAIVLASLALGVAFRYRARARARELDQVALMERERLARDLHDTVAHHVSAIAIRAQAGLATSAARLEVATEALRLIEAEASSTLAEMRSMVRVLRRDGPAELSPNPRIADLAGLAGENHGDPVVGVRISGDVHDVPPSVQAAVFRMAQESVTNARRHARHASRIQVCVAADEAEVRLRVDDDGDGGSTWAAEPGFGLRGMAERAHLLGGTFDAGPGAQRGWTVAAVLPRGGRS